MKSDTKKFGFYSDDIELLQYALPLFIKKIENDIPTLNSIEKADNARALSIFAQKAISSLEASYSLRFELNIAEMQAIYWAIYYLTETENYGPSNATRTNELLNIISRYLLDNGIDMNE